MNSKFVIIPAIIVLLFASIVVLPLSLALPSHNTTTNIVLPSEAAQVISTSFGTQGMLVTYTVNNGSVHAALYPNPQDGDGPTFIYNFIKK
jgi:hypothetical protein